MSVMWQIYVKRLLNLIWSDYDAAVMTLQTRTVACLGLAQTLATVSSGPARVLGSALGPQAASAGRLVVGAAADLCIFDPTAAWTVQPAHLRSQGKHTPFFGYELPGCVRYTIVGGRVAFQAA